MKKTFTLLFSLVLFNVCFAQKNFKLTVYVDSTIDVKKLKFYCNNGKVDIRPTDTFRNSKQVLTGEYYSKYVTVTVYSYQNEKFQFKQYWITDKPATLILRNSKELFTRAATKNMSDVLEMNSALKKKLDDFIKKESNAISELWANEALQKNRLVFDSINKALFVSWFEKSTQFIKAHNTNYYYFWHFNDQFYQRVKTIYKNDTALLVRVRDSFVSIFPKNILTSFEGKKIISEVENYIRPKTGIIAPHFKVNDINGMLIDLKNYKGKFVLLDFWASWCPPCIKQIPFVKRLRSEFANEDLEIIGINIDSDYKKATAFISSMGMNWTHIYDNDKDLSNLFSVDAIPVLILIDKDGKIIYDSRSTLGDEKELINLLKQK